MIGQTLAHYKILEKIGSGGMGDVYLAEDTKLDRKVALKVLPPELAENEERRARFQREAKAIAALDHPNIVQVFSVEEADGIHFITMQLVHGKTLTELLPKNGFPLNKFFEIAIPLTDAVAGAHQEGITHRDLKPDNTMLGDDGRVKVLDFGLAKPTSGFVGGDANSALPTAAKTAEGVIVGTANYMSPEQAQGQSVDARSDIFSLGIIFYEMVTGRRPFSGDNPASVLSSIIKDDPRSLAELDPDLPRDLIKIVRRCLAKDPLRRFQSTIDLRNDLEELKQDVASGEVSAAVVRQTSRAPIMALSLVATLAVAIVIFLVLPKGDPIPRLTNPVQITSAIGVEDYPTWSPDGRMLAYAATQDGNSRAGNWDIWLARVDGGQPVNRTADHAGMDTSPSWSPDGGQIAFWSDREDGGYFVMSALGGSAQKVISSPVVTFSPPRWSDDAEELAGVVRDDSGGFVVEIVHLISRESRRVSLPGQRNGREDLSWSPDQRLFAYVDAANPMNDVTRLWTLNLGNQQAFEVTSGRTKVFSPQWSQDGRALFFLSNRGGSMDLWRQSLDPGGSPAGDAQPIAAGIGMRRAVFSRDGAKLAYSRGRLVSNLWRVPILEDRPATWADAQQITHENARLEFLDVSPDGERLAVSSDRSGKPALWLLPVSGGDMVQLSTDPGPDWDPVWSPSGEEVAFFSYRTGTRSIWVMPVSGGPARLLTDGKENSTFPAWSPDGRAIAFSGIGIISVIPSDGGEPRRVAQGGGPRWSPDGESLVYSRSGGLWRVRAEGGEPELLTHSGSTARWSKDGKQVFFLGRDERQGNIWTLSLEGGSEHPMTDLIGKRGSVGDYALATDGEYLYFTWEEDVGDIWVMDVVTDESE